MMKAPPIHMTPQHRTFALILPLLAGCLALIMPLAAAAAPEQTPPRQTLSFRTESYPPYNFQRDGETVGMAVDLLLAIEHNMHAPLRREQIKLGPWARGYQFALKRKNNCIFSTTRTAEREPHFQWVGPISDTIVVLVARRDRHITIHSFDDLKQYKIGTVIKDIGEQLLTAGGIAIDRLDRLSGRHVVASSLTKLQKGRIDLFAYEGNVVQWNIRQHHFPADLFEQVYLLKRGELYYACNRHSDPAAIHAMQQSLDQLKANGQYAKIIAPYQ